MIDLVVEVRGPCDVHTVRRMASLHFGVLNTQSREGVFGDLVIKVEKISSVVVPGFIEWLTENEVSWSMKMVPTRHLCSV